MKRLRGLITEWNDAIRSLYSPDRHHSLLEGLGKLAAILSPDHPDGPTGRYALNRVETYTRNPHLVHCARNEADSEAGSNEVEDSEQLLCLLHDIGAISSGQAKIERVFLKCFRGRPGNQDKGFVTQRSQAHLLLKPIRRDGYQHLFVEDDRACETNVRYGHPNKPDIKTPVKHPFNLILAPQVLHFECDVWVGLSERDDCSGQQVTDGSDSESDPKTLKVSPHGLSRE